MNIIVFSDIIETRNGKFCMRGWKPRYQINRAVKVYFIMRIAKQEDKMKRLIALALVILSLVGLAACRGEEDKQTTVDGTDADTAITANSQENNTTGSESAGGETAAESETQTKIYPTAARSTEKHTEKATAKSTTITRGEKYSRKFVANKYDKYNNNIDKSAAASYAADDIVKNFLYYALLNSQSSSHVFSFKDFTHKYPTDCVRSLDGNLYAVYRVNEGGYFYAFFSDEMLLSHTAYITRKNSFADFADIKKGSSFADFAAVEPAAATVAQLFKGSKFAPPLTLILADGLLSVDFDDSFAVKNISYQPGKIQVVNNDLFYVELNYGILDKDLPD